ncbi:hypothetical protein EI53_01278 [Fusobacterium naviforme]|nr:hypothetical protein F7P78_06385 [Fusobacterium naviforme]PSL10216.1 hypothetical protein EI53_01278 [Fusobacterium naviforme]STO27626.1 Uncharacterised protein [Fusobacterium naviforme]
MRMDKNAEGYADPTAGEAYKNIVREERAKAYEAEGERVSRISSLIPILRATAELAGFDIIGRIPLKDRETGKEYR